MARPLPPPPLSLLMAWLLVEFFLDFPNLNSFFSAKQQDNEENTESCLTKANLTIFSFSL